MSYNPHSSSSNLLGDLQGSITADDDSAAEEGRARNLAPPTSISSNNNSSANPPTARGSVQTTGTGSDAQNGNVFSQSSHPVALFFLYFFRCAAIATYLLCGFFSSSYVFSTVLVVVLLSLDFWTVRNVSGRVLVGLRFWNQVDDDGTSFWVFESRSPEQPANAVDSKMFWIAMYSFPAAWILLFFIGLLKFNLSFLPIVLLALVFNVTNTVGYTYAVRLEFPPPFFFFHQTFLTRLPLRFHPHPHHLLPQVATDSSPSPPSRIATRSASGRREWQRAGCWVNSAGGWAVLEVRS